MGEKDAAITVRVDSDVKQQLDTEENVNTSAVVRSMLETYLLRGDAVEVGLERRIEQKRRELERLRLQKQQLETDIESVQHEVETLEEQLSERRQSTPEEVVQFAERIESGRFSHDQLDAENPALMNWASKAGLPPERFITEVKTRL